MRVVLAPDAFKGSLSQVEVAEVMKEAIESTNQQANCIVKPMADGGEGTLMACKRGRMDMKIDTIPVTGPRGERIEVLIGLTEDHVAMIEIAAIVGMDLISEDARDPGWMTTYGIGEAMRYVLDRGAKEIIVGLGGSVTNDGGIGLLQALGATIEQTNGEAHTPLRGKDLSTVTRVDVSTVDERIWKTIIRIASDVSNPLCGENGATFVFAPQKGVREETLQKIDEHMQNYVQTIEGSAVKAEEIAIRQGAGAAGGLGFSLLLLHGIMEQGASVVGELIQLDQAIQQADLVITGEGKTDAQTMRGKAPFYVATRGKAFSVPTMLVSGKVEQADWLASHFTETYALVSKDISEERAMQDTEVVLTKTMQTIFRRMT